MSETLATRGAAAPARGPRSRHALVVLVHPRPDSLTATMAARARDRLSATGYTVDLLDLYAEGFDPALRPDDEPDWADAGKEYSAEVRGHMARVAAADLIVVVFPVWWYGLPAMAKGWVDRVWNRGFAYEPATLAGRRMLWIGLAGGPADHFAAHDFDRVLDVQLRVGISEYCGIADVEVHLIHDTLTEPRVEAVDEVLGRATAAA
ncbi:putative NADPH-quinone reductase [Nocardioides thalensis]|uniref:Putative NADPH-quinone reductase n=1 Tax=Nocardioides thalensis TaxID=1914755 RepID=A0A853C8K9_9ACTN|nr:NAD(P)H oxidoreductase [Nocardioides thalensis]NYJ03657.1 putative NADPH-quinone reductase [Nocardioides thalensis]